MPVLPVVVREQRMVGVEEVNDAVYNPRDMTPQAFQKLKDSLRELGFLEPIVVNADTMVLVGGHQRRRAWIELGGTEMPAALCEFPSDAVEKTANIALNNAEMTGTYNKSKLVELLDGIRSVDERLVEITGFQNHELERFRRQVEKASGPSAVYPIAAKMMEHYDYVVIFCDNETDFAHLRTILGVKTETSYKKQRKGIGRVVPFAKFIEKWEARGGGANTGVVAEPKGRGGKRRGRPDVRPDAEAGGPGEASGL